MRESPLKKSTENKCKPCPKYNKTHWMPNIRSVHFFHPFVVNEADGQENNARNLTVTALLFCITKGLQVLELDKFSTCPFRAYLAHLAQRFPHFLHSWNLTPAATDWGLYIKRQKQILVLLETSVIRNEKIILKRDDYDYIKKSSKLCSEGARHQHLIRKKKYLGWLQNNHQKVTQYINPFSCGSSAFT